MARLAVLEILDRDGRARIVHPVSQWPLTVGRGLDNDVVLDDPHLAAHHFTLDVPHPAAEPDAVGASADPPAPHASVEAAVQATVSDETINGLRLGRRHYPPGSTMQLRSGTEWTAGTTRLRLRLADAPLAAEQPVARTTWWTIASPLLALAVLAAFMALEGYLDSNEALTASQVLQSIWPMLPVIGSWALLWAVASKLFRHQMMFWRHVAIAAWGIVAVYVLGYVTSGLAYALSWPWLNLAQGDAAWLIAAGVIWAHLRVVLVVRWRVLVAGYIVGLVTLALVALLLALRYADTGRIWPAWYNGSLGPAWLRVAPAVSVDAFIQQAAPLEPQLLQDLEKAADTPSGSDLQEPFDEDTAPFIDE